MKRGLLMKNIKLTIQYDGTRYQGWQKPGKKGNSNTISGKLTEVISRITNEETILFAGAKTDTNVHADAQIVNFKTNTTLSALKLKQELKSQHVEIEDVFYCVLEKQGLFFIKK